MKRMVYQRSRATGISKGMILKSLESQEKLNVRLDRYLFGFIFKFYVFFFLQSWTDTVFKWSPHGSYLTTIHKRGVALWGGPEFSRVQRFAHENVQFIDFSPCETLVDASKSPTALPSPMAL